MATAAVLINGLLVTKRNVSPFLAILATAIMLEGMRFVLTSGNIPPVFKTLGNGDLFGVPVLVLVMPVVTLMP